MNRYVPVFILIACFHAASWAQSDVDIAADTGDSSQLRPDAETDANGQQFAQRVRARVLDAVLEAIEDDADISDADKQAATQALRHGLDSDDPVNTGFIAQLLTDIETDIDSAASPYAGLGIEDRGDGLWIGTVAILSIVLIFGTPIMLVAAVLYAGHRKRRLASDMASQYLANGQPVPPEVWTGLSGDATPRNNLHKGMILLGVGLGVFLCFWLIGSITAAYLGLIPMFIGIAQLLIWKLEKQKAAPLE